jgi:hypothetical protein
LGASSEFTYSKEDLSSSGSLRERVGGAVGVSAVNLGEGEALIVVVSDGEALDEVGELADDVEVGVPAGRVEGAVARAGATLKLVARL